MSYVRLNGRGGDRYLGDLLDDIINAGKQTASDVVQTGQNDLSNQAGDLATELINSSQFKIVLDAVEKKAEDGVKKVTAQNALALCVIAAGAGIVGGTFLKGKIGGGIAALMVGAGVAYIVNNSSTTTTTK